MGKAVGKAAFMLFLYLELIDASFSFDGVIGAFAITSDPIIIALGLGLIGAIFVRSLTVYLVREGTLDDYEYLDHGAHWAIGALALILLLTISVEINEIITGLIGVLFIGAAFISSIVRNKRVLRQDAAQSGPAFQLTHHYINSHHYSKEQNVMGLSLQKGQSLSLKKNDGGSLTRVRMGLGLGLGRPGQARPVRHEEGRRG